MLSLLVVPLGFADPTLQVTVRCGAMTCTGQSGPTLFLDCLPAPLCRLAISEVLFNFDLIMHRIGQQFS